MNKTYTKAADGITLVETRTPDPIQPAVVEQNFDLEYLTSQVDVLVEKRANTVLANDAALASVDKEIADNQARLDKAAELGIKTKSEVAVEQIITDNVEPII